MTNEFPISILTLDSDLDAAVASVCASLNIDPNRRLTFRDGATETERPIADLLRGALYVSALGVPPGADVVVWQSG